MDSRSQFIDEMSHEERSVWLYYFVIGCSVRDTAKRLKLPYGYVNESVKNLRICQDCLSLSDKIREAFSYDD